MIEKTSVILADDHSLMRAAIASLLENNGYEVIAQASSYPELEQVFQTHSADILISDCRMEGKGPLNFLKFVRRFHKDCQIIFLTGLESGILFQQLLSAGAHGLVSKKGEVNDVLSAIEKVKKDEIYVSKGFLKEIDSTTSLTVTEYQVLELVVQGLSNNQLADQLNKAPGTINSHRVNIMRKLNVHSIVELIHFCRKNGLYDC